MGGYNGYIGFECDPDGFIVAQGGVCDGETVAGYIESGAAGVPEDWKPTESELNDILDAACDSLNDDNAMLDEVLSASVCSAITCAAQKVYDATHAGA